jgi:hypothetical protein
VEDQVIREYLQEAGGLMWNYQMHLVAGFSAGTAFLSAISTYDIYTLRNEGVYDEIRTKSRPDDPLILEAIALLKEMS